MKKILFVSFVLMTTAAISAYTYLPGNWNIPSVEAQNTFSREISPAKNLFSNFQSWPSSSKLKVTPVPFSLPMITLFTYPENGYYHGPLSQDMNGDGLVDLVFSESYGTSLKQYVLLSTGSGYEIAYICFGSSTRDPLTNITSWVYYGDCADTN